VHRRTAGVGQRARMVTILPAALSLLAATHAGPSTAQDWHSAQRARMVAEIASRARETGAATGRPSLSKAVMTAMGTVPRHRFVPAALEGLAYKNQALPIGEGQTISQPFLVALMTDLIEPKAGDTVLEVGTGSGYQAAVLAELVAKVYTIEIVEPLGRRAMQLLGELGYRNVEVRIAENDLARFKFENYVKEIFVDSDTKIALLSGAPFDDPTWDLLNNDQIAAARAAINRIAGSRRLLGHSVFTPKKAGWMAEVDRCIASAKPDSWKGYTVGDPLFPSKAQSYWRLDEEKLMYPFYEKIVKAGSPIVCIHKGLLPADYEKSWPRVWEYNTVWDVGKAAKDWPQVTFVIYHSALRMFQESPAATMAEFEKTGRIKWATDLAEIPAKFGVNNVYGEIGTSFASCAVANPALAAALVATLVRGLGTDRVLWGSDSVWYGSPQWQIEALRRLEIPEAMRKQHHFTPLGPADGLVKTAIFSANAARLYGIQARTALGAIRHDHIAAIRDEYVANGGTRSNARYGYVHRGMA
jgi:uncharacterized protein